MATATKKETPAAEKPAAKPRASGTTTAAAKNRIGVFIDLENSGASLINAQEILHSLGNMGKVNYGKLYGYADENVEKFKDLLGEFHFETMGKSRLKDHSESTVDLSFVMDIISCAGKKLFDKVFVWLGKGDLIPLFSKLREMKLYTMTVDLPGFDSQNEFVSQRLRLFSPYSPTGFGAAAPAQQSVSKPSAPEVQPKAFVQPTAAPEPVQLDADGLTPEEAAEVDRMIAEKEATRKEPTQEEVGAQMLETIKGIVASWSPDNARLLGMEYKPPEGEEPVVDNLPPTPIMAYDSGEDKALREDRPPEDDPYAQNDIVGFSDAFAPGGKRE